MSDDEAGFDFGGGGFGNEEGGGGIGGDGTFQETEYSSLGDRLKGSCMGICLGLILFFGSFPLLFWNEERAVQRYDALQEGEAKTVSVSGLNLDSANEGKLLHFTADVVNGGDPVVDPVFGIQTDGIVLSRYAQMYQWYEDVQTSTRKTTGGSKKTTRTYRYYKDWRDYLINSNQFKRSGYDNPTYMRFEPEVFPADTIMIGAYELPRELVGRINWAKPMGVELEDITDESLRSEAAVDYDTGGYYYGYSASNPQIGDQRVYFTETPSSTITIVGVQSSGTLSAFVSESGEGGDILLFKQGNYTAAEMYEAAEAENAAATWILRGVGFAVMALGIYLMLRPIEVFADIIPCVGSIVGCGLAFMALLIASILSTITVSIAWLIAHPEIGGIVLGVMLVVIGLCAFCIKKLVKRKHDVNDGGKVASGFDVPAGSPDFGNADGDIQVVQGAVLADEIPVVQSIAVDDNNIPTVQGQTVMMTAEEKRLHDQIAQQ